jgi:hypothetical protein
MNSKKTHRLAMKWICLPFLCLVATGTSLGQESQGSTAPNIEILKLKWDREVRLPRDFDPSIIPTGSTFSDPASRSSGPTGTAAADTSRGGGAVANRASPSNPNITFPATPGRLPVFYVYSLKIRNVGLKAIEGLAWDYLLIDPDSNTELGRHQFLSYAKARTNKSLELHGQLRSPPVRVVRASGQKTQPRFIERAVIECVLYADDTVWRNPQARDGVCELLKNNKALIKRKAG